MRDDLKSLIAQHLHHMSSIEKCSLIIEKLATQGKYQEVLSELQNRERLIKIVHSVQTSIDQKVESPIIDKKDLYLARNWSKKVVNWIENIKEIDNRVFENLTQHKTQNGKQIAHLFKSKNAIKGYNLNDLK